MLLFLMDCFAVSIFTAVADFRVTMLARCLNILFRPYCNCRYAGWHIYLLQGQVYTL